MGFAAIQPDDTNSPLYQWHESLESYIGAVIYTPKRHPDLKAKLMEPYETMSEAVREARKRLRPEPEPTTESETETAPSLP